VHTEDRFGRPGAFKARKLAISTGYYDLPNYMHIPGENLSKVHHYYNDPHPYFEMDVVVIGGKNSAAIAALELWRSGARVTLVHRDPEMQPHVKYWIKPDIENRIKNGEVKALFQLAGGGDHAGRGVVETPEGRQTLKNDFVFAMTGYHPDFDFLERLGVRFEGPDRLPVCDAETLESNVPGIYLAGVIVAGSRTNEILLRMGDFTGGRLPARLASKFDSLDGRRLLRFGYGRPEPVQVAPRAGLHPFARRYGARGDFGGRQVLLGLFYALVAAVDSMADAGGLVLLEVLSIGLFAALLIRQQAHEVHERMLHRLAHQATPCALQAKEALQQQRRTWVGLSVKMMGEAPSVAFAKVTDPAGNVLFVSAGEPEH
jgi:hypothetical protein